MTIFQAIIIAIIEGLTEFLPISSTAHMRFANPFLGIQPSPFVDMFEVVIQFAAILSVVVIFYKKFFDFKRTTFYLKLIIAVIPALIVGAILKDYIDTALDNLIFISCVMIGGGILLLFIDKLFKRNNIDDEREISLPKAFAIGCFQCLAILLPGLSRSAATIVGGMQQKLTRTLAAEFSFFLAVPTMFAASVKSFWDVYKDHPDTLVSSNISVLVIGAVVSFIVALIAVKSFIGYLQKHGFKAFGVYRIILGVVILVLALKGML
ncbi:undecaprenyl-diphosphate phosphatase [Parafilimonas terrae]|jgi:undecaprenyl-diphosphatase|uniref:Undecaprenyl-diphosphatase n=1 Tax=Parafilimonas terrae TaxID=1465490 RepID=A0A1I5R4W3_9BACT|nr:undecaprenyl-diphosphate phosphatase [Parafilimonas terrae]SFP53076.1 undecaprenyl-diphosphatase [Parafilimonas terrae]